MPVTIALSGMDSATETALRAAFASANRQLGDTCALVSEPESRLVIVDMDSMYGPMSWLRLHAAGKQVIGLTSAPRVQTHFRLGRPFDEAALVVLLREIADSEGIPLGGTAAAAPRQADDAARITPAPAAPAPAPAQAQATRPAESAPSATAVEAAPVHVPTQGDREKAGDDAPAVATPANGAWAALVPSVPSDAGLPVETAVDAQLADELPLVDWLAGRALRGRRRYRTDTGPTLLIDLDAQLYHGPTTLKPMTPYFQGLVAREALESLDDAQWARDTAAAGPAQPLLRLRWLGALLAGDGSLAPGHDPDARYVLNKWPQTEREYPRHFRIATAMMKGPATLEEVIAASGLPADEVYRFVNASLATGYAEPVIDVPEDATDAQKSSGFFSRLRRR
ncbi:hypothetical protein [Luteimonas deserti]|uniref:Uncharacterized protein n=1 Tax=Luteimonas deserti TaxID=2752306 RepID=A0A7Z0TY99_9GAMM|nr:hypothetical protein [Luteimonas deserti]NYZ62705.1 hypothetical protein [Luteimonas deserti]